MEVNIVLKELVCRLYFFLYSFYELLYYCVLDYYPNANYTNIKRKQTKKVVDNKYYIYFYTTYGVLVDIQKLQIYVTQFKEMRVKE